MPGENLQSVITSPELNTQKVEDNSYFKLFFYDPIPLETVVLGVIFLFASILLPLFVFPEINNYIYTNSIILFLLPIACFLFAVPNIIFGILSVRNKKNIKICIASEIITIILFSTLIVLSVFSRQ
jgi:hypothetical protein